MRRNFFSVECKNVEDKGLLFFDTKFFFTERFLLLCEFWQQIKNGQGIGLISHKLFPTTFIYATYCKDHLFFGFEKMFFDFANF